MSLFLLATGSLIADPQKREGANGSFTTATIRTSSGDEAALVSVIGFGDEAGELLKLSKGDAVSVSGRAKLTHWTGRDGAERRGLSVVVEQLAAANPRPKPRRVVRRPYPATRPTRDSGAPLPEDSVADLFVTACPTTERSSRRWA